MKRAEAFASIPKKANRVLYYVLLGFMVIGARLWYLTISSHEEKVQEARRTRKRIVVEPALRGTIRDRFNLMLATNALEYRIGVCWTPIQEIPRRVADRKGRRLLRKEYVHALSKMLSRQLQLDAERIEDIIYSYAALSGNSPVILKTGLTEEAYYRLNMLAKDWPGLVVERTAKRVYPRGKSCCHVVGYTAPLQREEFDKAVSETAALRDYVAKVERKEQEASGPEFFAAKQRLLNLEHRAYRFHDEIGKIGIEAAFERQLRGLSGKRLFITTAHGEVVREESGSRDPVSGKRVVLSLSAELQEWCEQLLAETEQDRYTAAAKSTDTGPNPRVRGGAIVAIDPRSAEVLACASYPQFDPNDFVRIHPALFDVPHEQKSLTWIKNEGYVRRIWDQEWPWLPEDGGPFWMTWRRFIDEVIPQNFSLKNQLFFPVGELVALQKGLFDLVHPNDKGYLSAAQRLIQHRPCSNTLSSGVQALTEAASDPMDLLYLADLSRLIVRYEELPEALWKQLFHISLEEMHAMIGAKSCLMDAIASSARKAFAIGPFAAWRKDHEAAFIAERRKEEQTAQRIAQPYLSYLDAEQKRQFTSWWELTGEQLLWSILSGNTKSVPDWARGAIVHCLETFFSTHTQHKEGGKRLCLLLEHVCQEDGILFLSSLKGFEGLRHMVWGQYTATVQGPAPKNGQQLVRAFLSLEAAPMASFCYMQPSPPGSIFKLVVGYAALHKQLDLLHGDETKLSSSFFRMNDTYWRQGTKAFVGTDAEGKPIPQAFKGGRIPKSLTTHIGEIDMVRAIEYSSNPYFSLLAADFLESPIKLLDAATAFGYGQKTGMLPWESPGSLPTDLLSNKTGVYTTAIGQHTLLATPLQSAVMLSTLATQGDVIVPRLVKMVAGHELSVQRRILGRSSFPHRALMCHAGIDFPIWLQDRAGLHQHLIVTKKKLARHVPLSATEQTILFTGMRAACEKIMSDPRVAFAFQHRPDLVGALQEFQGYVIGKSGTAEVLARIGIGMRQPPSVFNHTSFGAIFFSKERPQEPELVVVVLLRYGTLGREASPLAASVARKWKEIQKKHSQKT